MFTHPKSFDFDHMSSSYCLYIQIQTNCRFFLYRCDASFGVFCARLASSICENLAIHLYTSDIFWIIRYFQLANYFRNVVKLLLDKVILI